MPCAGAVPVICRAVPARRMCPGDKRRTAEAVIPAAERCRSCHADTEKRTGTTRSVSFMRASVRFLYHFFYSSVIFRSFVSDDHLPFISSLPYSFSCPVFPRDPAAVSTGYAAFCDPLFLYNNGPDCLGHSRPRGRASCTGCGIPIHYYVRITFSASVMSGPFAERPERRLIYP